MTMLSMMKLLKKKYNSQVDIGRDSHNNDYDAVLDNLRAEEKNISLITDFTISNPDIQDYCKHLILYNLTVHDYKTYHLENGLLILRDYPDLHIYR